MRLEIIETYWNVNLGEELGPVAKETEIIETYWNVNTEMKLTAESL